MTELPNHETPTTPAVPPAPVADATPGPLKPPAASPLDRRPQPGARRPGGASRAFPQSQKPSGEKPLNPGGKPPQLDKQDFGGAKPNNRELDKLIEDEMNQAMAGFDVKTTVVAEEKKPSGTKSQRKKGVIVSIHGKDVFVEVPGGRSQGVLRSSSSKTSRPRSATPSSSKSNASTPATGSSSSPAKAPRRSSKTGPASPTGSSSK